MSFHTVCLPDSRSVVRFRVPCIHGRPQSSRLVSLHAKTRFLVVVRVGVQWCVQQAEQAPRCYSGVSNFSSLHDYACGISASGAPTVLQTSTRNPKRRTSLPYLFGKRRVFTLEQGHLLAHHCHVRMQLHVRIHCHVST